MTDLDKFSERVQTDPFVFNEVGDPDDLVATGSASYTPLEDWSDLSSLNLLNHGQGTKKAIIWLKFGALSAARLDAGKAWIGAVILPTYIYRYLAYPM